MDGFDAPMMTQPTSREDALINVAIRLGGVEQSLRSSVTHEKLMVVMNEHRREITETVKGSENHLGSMIEAQSKLSTQRDREAREAQDRRINELLESLARMSAERDRGIDARISEAVKTALKERDEMEANARKAVDDKAKDAVRGWKMFFTGGGAIVGGALALVALFILKMTLGWSPFG
jgi:VIT1/CCC1 family predicted Fe2+/Mn2+ transporter